MPHHYLPPKYLLGCHVQTIYPALWMPSPSPHFDREVWNTPDGDIIALDWLSYKAEQPLLVLFHGLEGSSQSHYAKRIMAHAEQLGWNGVVVHFRSCGGLDNLKPRSYHSGDSAEIDWILRRLRKEHLGSIHAAGVSLGGNALLKWLGEQEDDAQAIIDKAVAISAPVSLPTTGHVLGTGFNMVYTKLFLKTLKPKALALIAKYQLDFDTQAIQNCKTLWQYDNLFTAPLHGFKDAHDYWQQSNSRPFLNKIQLPTMLINAQNDPFLPAKDLPLAHEVSPMVERVFPQQGGHVGFAGKHSKTGQDWLPSRIFEFLRAHK